MTNSPASFFPQPETLRDAETRLLPTIGGSVI
jgi:hypothetical protein